MPKEKICPVSEVRISIPRKRLIKLFYDFSALDPYDNVEMRGFLRKLEKNIEALRHVASIVENILLRSG